MIEQTPLIRYQKELTSGDLQPDTAQKEAILKLEAIYQALLKKNAWYLSWIPSSFRPKSQPIIGLYLWGDVGRGKTHLVDLFYESLPLSRKRRSHFYEFMDEIHQRLIQFKGRRDPLHRIADELSKAYQVICFDEFFVSDIADAMLLGTLFTALFDRGVTLIATSNCAPDQLYKNGLQRARFLPAIGQIYKHCEVFELQSPQDYRLHFLEKAQVFHFPIDDLSLKQLEHYFSQLSEQIEPETAPLKLNNREVKVVKRTERVIWIDFDSLCGEGRGYQDYLALSKTYSAVLIEGICQMGDGAAGDDKARRFLSAIDAFYDRQVTVIMTSTHPVEELYLAGQLTFEFKRCLSRLHEMQSQHYLSLEHLAE